MVGNGEEDAADWSNALDLASMDIFKLLDKDNYNQLNLYDEPDLLKQFMKQADQINSVFGHTEWPQGKVNYNQWLNINFGDLDDMAREKT